MTTLDDRELRNVADRTATQALGAARYAAAGALIDVEQQALPALVLELDALRLELRAAASTIAEALREAGRVG